MNNYVVTTFYADHPGEESRYSQVRGMKSSSAAFHRVYYRCVMTLMASSVQCNPGALHFFVCNQEVLPVVDGVDLRARLSDLGVQVVTLPMSYGPPPGYCDAWRATFYFLDAVEYVSSLMAADDAAIVLDSDCLCVRSLDAVFEGIRESGIHFYEEISAPDADINGLSRSTRCQIFAEMSGLPVDGIPIHVGGEFLGFTGAAGVALCEAMQRAWRMQLDRYSHGQAVLTTEEHIFSYIAWVLDLPVGDANRYCRRIWTRRGLTGRGYSNSLASDLELAIWHLPGEKPYALHALWRAWIRNRGPLMGPVDSGRLMELAAYCAVPKMSLRRWFRDAIRRLALAAESSAVRLKGL